jgi:4-oxalocrotonate tautomerase
MARTSPNWAPSSANVAAFMEADVPLVEVTLVEGRTPARIRSLVGELHRAVVRALDAPPDAVRVIVREVPPTHWAAGGITIAERQAQPGPE